MSALLDLLDDAARGRGTIAFDFDHEGRPLGEVWSAAGRAASTLGAAFAPGDRIAMLLTSDPACAAALLGAWRAGLSVLSLPHPARATPRDEYVAQIERIADAAAVTSTYAIADEVELLGDRVAARPFDALLAPGPTGACDRGGGQLVQYTSGSTSDPKGVVLSLDAIAANVRSILRRIDLPEQPSLVSWLPLSHDMGLVGMFLTAWVSTGPAFGRGGHVRVIPTRRFVANPGVWMAACARWGAHATAGPNFAYDVVSRRPPGERLDLSSLRTCIVGAEPVRAASLRAFADALAPHGFDERALCPAYGMAEASLAVSITSPAARWSSMGVDPLCLGDGTIADAADGVELVSAGPALDDVEVSTVAAGASDVGELAVDGPSLFDGYVGRGARTGPHLTGDLGFVRDGHVYVAGRTDDRMSIAGRNVYAFDLEQIAGTVEGIRADHCVVVEDRDGRYLLVAERRRGTRFRDGTDDICRQARLALAKRVGVGPAAVVLLAPGGFPLTPSGKVQRTRIRLLYERDALDVDAVVSFRLPE